MCGDPIGPVPKGLAFGHRPHENRHPLVMTPDPGTGGLPKGMWVGCTTGAALVNELLVARDERRLLRVRENLAGAKLLFGLISRRDERGVELITATCLSTNGPRPSEYSGRSAHRARLCAYAGALDWTCGDRRSLVPRPPARFVINFQ